MYSESWMAAITQPRLGAALGRLIGPDVEVHHSTMHIKPPETGHPFPMHQVRTIPIALRPAAGSGAKSTCRVGPNHEP